MHTPLQAVQLSFSNSAPPPGQSNVAAFALAGQCSDKAARIGKLGINSSFFFGLTPPPPLPGPNYTFYAQCGSLSESMASSFSSSCRTLYQLDSSMSNVRCLMLGEARLVTSSIEYTGTLPMFPAAGPYFFCLSQDGGSTWYEQSGAALIVKSMYFAVRLEGTAWWLCMRAMLVLQSGERVWV